VGADVVHLPTVAADADEATEGERVILLAVLVGCSESLSSDEPPKLYLLLLDAAVDDLGGARVEDEAPP